MENIYIGINGIAQKINSIFIGDENNKAQEIYRIYIENNNKAQISGKTPIEIPKATADTSAMSSNVSANSALWKAFDGNDTTYWRSGTQKNPVSCTYDFGIEIYIEKIRLKTYAGNAEVYPFNISASKNNQDWDILYTYSNTTQFDNYIYYSDLEELYRNNSYRYFKYTSTPTTGTARYRGAYTFNIIGYK